ncbi:MAG: hypothetical protein ABII85_01825 [Bacillota bacterium]
MLANATIYLLDVDISPDAISGESIQTVNSFKKIIGEVSEVGVTTFWNAHSENANLDATIQIQSRTYSENKFIYLKRNSVGKLYEVVNVAKGESIDRIRLNLTESKIEGLKELVENAISGN